MKRQSLTLMPLPIFLVRVVVSLDHLDRQERPVSLVDLENPVHQVPLEFPESHQLLHGLIKT